VRGSKRAGATCCSRAAEQVAQLGFDTRPIDRPRAQRAPDLLHVAALQDQDATGANRRDPAGTRSWSGQRLVDESEQFRGQATLESDRRFGPVTKIVDPRREKIPLLVEILKVAVGVLV
jgi:hypothetical protein